MTKKYILAGILLISAALLSGSGSNTNSSSGGGSGTVTSVDASVPSVLSISGNPVTTTGTLAIDYSGVALPIANGGTGQVTANTAVNALLPSQASASGKYLTSDGSNSSWGTVSASPAGSDGDIQYNNGGAFGGVPFSYNDGTGGLTFTSPSGTPTNPIKFDFTNALGASSRMLIALGTMPATGTITMLRAQGVHAAGAAQIVTGFNSSISSGGTMTSDSSSYAANMANAGGNNSTNLSPWNGSGGQYGTYTYSSNQAATGTSMGLWSGAFQGGSANIGIQGYAATPASSSTKQYGVRGIATTESSAQGVGVYGSISPTDAGATESRNPGFSAGGIFDSSTTGKDVLIGMYNGSSVFHVRGGVNNAVVLGQAGTTTAVHEFNGAVSAGESDSMTILNGPAGTAGNPDTFLRVKINGVLYVIPAWTPTN